MPVHYRDFICILVIFCTCIGCARSSDGGSPPVATDGTEQVSTSALTKQWIQRLTQAGLSRNAAGAVVKLNADEWTDLAEDNPKKLEEQLNQVAKLGKHLSVAVTLEKQPDVAGLLAGSLQYAKDAPERLSKAITDREYGKYAKNYFHAHTLDYESHLHIADVYQRYGSLIARIYLHDKAYQTLVSLQVAPESLFDENPAHAEALIIYDKFRQECIESVLRNGSETEIANTLHYFCNNALPLREALDNSDEVRTNFGKYYRDVQEIAAARKDDFDVFSLLNLPDIWQVLAMPKGKEVMKECGWDGMAWLLTLQDLPTQTFDLYIYPALLDTKDYALLQAFLKFQESHFGLQQFLSKNISLDLKKKTLRNLLGEPHPVGKFNYYNGLPSASLEKELDPQPDGWVGWVPGYQVVKLGSKMLVDGRDVSTLDIVFAVADGVSFIPIGGVVVGGVKTVVQKGVTSLVTQGTNKIVIQSGKTLAARTAKEAAEEVAKKVPKILSVKGINYAITHPIQVIGGGKWMVWDITKMVKGSYVAVRRMGVSREAIKRYTGLDARVFMRRDRFAVLDLRKLEKAGLAYTLPRVITQETFENFFAEQVLSSEAAQATMGKIKEKVAGGDEVYVKVRKGQIREITPEQYRSALWLSAATGELDTAANLTTEKSL